jgi:hypothetical protein
MENRIAQTLVPSTMYQEFHKEGTLDALSFFCFAKAVYERNPIFYNYTNLKLSQQLGISVSTLRARLNYLTSKGLVHRHSGHLCFLGLDKLCQKYVGKRYSKSMGNILQIPIGANLSETKFLVGSYPILVSIKRQQKQISKKGALKSLHAKAEKNIPLQKGEYGKYKKYLKLKAKGEDPLKSFEENVILSSKKQAELSNRSSRTTGVKRRKLLEKSNLVQTQRNFVTYGWLEVDISTKLPDVKAYFAYLKAHDRYPAHCKLDHTHKKTNGKKISYRVVVEGARIFSLVSDIREQAKSFEPNQQVFGQEKIFQNLSYSELFDSPKDTGRKAVG